MRRLRCNVALSPQADTRALTFLAALRSLELTMEMANTTITTTAAAGVRDVPMPDTRS